MEVLSSKKYPIHKFSIGLKMIANHYANENVGKVCLSEFASAIPPSELSEKILNHGYNHFAKFFWKTRSLKKSSRLALAELRIFIGDNNYSRCIYDDLCHQAMTNIMLTKRQLNVRQSILQLVRLIAAIAFVLSYAFSIGFFVG